MRPVCHVQMPRRNKIELASCYRIRGASCTSQSLRLRTSSCRSHTNRSCSCGPALTLHPRLLQRRPCNGCWPGRTSPAREYLHRLLRKGCVQLKTSSLVPSDRDRTYFEDPFASNRPHKATCLPETSVRLSAFNSWGIGLTYEEGSMTIVVK